jgi:hypothetical protein
VFAKKKKMAVVSLRSDCSNNIAQMFTQQAMKVRIEIMKLSEVIVLFHFNLTFDRQNAF